jgi:5-methylcytosine-specific restriction endonuclease McrA
VDPAKPKWKPKQERECPYCGELALMGSRQQQCGKNECRLARNAERMRVKYSHLTTAHKQRRRAQRVTTQTEVIRAAEIYDRDGWQCGICLKPVDPAVKYPNPMSVSLDHVTPLSLGGPHAAENVRCAHLICNVRRGNRVAIAT